MQEQLFLFGVVLIAIIFATISDLKTFEIPDAISYFLIIFGISAQIILAATSQSLQPINALLISLAIASAIALPLFLLGQWGGGDTKLLLGIAAVLPTFHTTTLPFILTFTFNLFLFGGIYSILIMIYLSIRNWKKLIELSPISKKLLIITVLASFLPFIIQNIFFILVPVIVGGITIINLALVLQKHFFIKKIHPSKLTEGDWITKDLKIGNKTIYKVRKIGVLDKDIQKIQKYYKKSIEIKTGIAFGPSFLFSILISGYFGDILFQIIPQVLSKI
ncbi:MAG: prepilin peptidase [Candidatus Nanoarchaeia archaeon]|jgi:Flp pilus assembly protein protease CpaA|nr:prepilin peptidase [Candidatus Nanoarchaeia archaeon]|tara:strand:- start:3377 stop:4207 length:831 start_codon:yes stop_codon:yes gene_type:complete